MFRKFIQGFILGVITTGAITIGAEIFAQEVPKTITDEDVEVQLQKPVQCYPAGVVNQMSIDKDFSVLWQGGNLKDGFADNTIVIMTNNDTNAFVALEINASTACILGYGGGFWLLDQYYPSFTEESS
tara:strand:- start:149 stop:532 length:384 start_codon:yes stop_codon:yes gene_type:complete